MANPGGAVRHQPFPYLSRDGDGSLTIFLRLRNCAVDEHFENVPQVVFDSGDTSWDDTPIIRLNLGRTQN